MHPADAAARENATSNSSPSSTSSTAAPADQNHLFDRTRTIPCSPTPFNGTVLGNGSCIVQPGGGGAPAWVSASAAAAVVSAPSESDCCSQCRARQAPNARSPPETSCVFTYCDVGPGLYLAGSCDDGLGGTMRDGECRVALVPLPLEKGLEKSPPLGSIPPASPGLVSGAPASSFLLPVKAAAPPRGYRAAGPVRLPGGPAAFDGGCDFSTDELLRKSVSRPECAANASTPAAAAKLCSKLRGCTGLSWYPTNGVPILRAHSTPSGFADVGNPAFGAVAAGEPVTRSSSLAVFHYGALDERCVAPSPYSFLFVQEDAPRPPGLDHAPFESAQEEVMDAARKRRAARQN